MIFKVITPSKSEAFIVEKHKTLLPTIIFFNEKIGNTEIYSFKFSFWRWWYKVGFYAID